MPFRLPHEVGRRIELPGAPRFVHPSEITQRMVPGKRFSRVDELSGPVSVGPVVVEGTTTSASSGTQTHSVSLPSGVASGDLLLAFFLISQGAPDSIDAPPSGWTELFTMGEASGSACGCFYKVAAGGETAVTVTAPAENRNGIHVSYRLSGAGGTPEVATNASGIDPPSITPSWGSAETLFIAFAVQKDDNLTGIPTNYSNEVRREDTGDTTEVSTARRLLTASSEDPGVFGGTGDRSATIAVQPG